MISIAIPIYNAEKFLPRCLDSIINQGISDWELLLIDDGSTDHSGLIADDYAAEDKRVKVVHQANKGQSAARNRGMDMASGQYLMFVDADDWLEEGYLQFMLSHIGDADMLQTGYRRITPEGKLIEQRCPNWHRRYTLISPCMRLYRREYIEAHKLRFAEGMIYEDVLFSARLWKTKPQIRVEEYYGYCYLVNPGSTTSRPHNTERIRRMLREEGLGLFTFNHLRLRLAAHFLKERIHHFMVKK